MGFSISKNITLLAAGYHNPKSGSQGSGIYHGFKKVSNITYSQFSGSKIITAKVGIHRNVAELPNYHINGFYLFEDMSNYQKIDLPNGKNELTFFDENLICHIKYDYCGLPNQMQIIIFRKLSHSTSL